MFMVRLYNGDGRVKWVSVRAKNGRSALFYADDMYWPEWKSEVAVNIHLLKLNDGFKGWIFRRLYNEM